MHKIVIEEQISFKETIDSRTGEEVIRGKVMGLFCRNPFYEALLFLNNNEQMNPS